jgi:hypothetical protein
MWFFKKVLIAVFFVIFATKSFAESNLAIVLSDVKEHNNIYALNYLIGQSENNENFFTEIGMSETDFLALKDKVCAENLKKTATMFEYEKQNVEMICGVEILAQQ